MNNSTAAGDPGGADRLVRAIAHAHGIVAQLHVDAFAIANAIRNVSVDELLSATRTASLTEARWIVVHLLYNRGHVTKLRIGELMRRHHSSVIHALLSMTRRRRTDPQLHAMLQLADQRWDQLQSSRVLSPAADGASGGNAA